MWREQEYKDEKNIVIKDEWKQKYLELWEQLVPASGKANTIQGEVLRIVGKVSHELLDNGGINWNVDYEELLDNLQQYLKTGNELSRMEQHELLTIIREIKLGKINEKKINYMIEMSVKWVVNNLV